MAGTDRELRATGNLNKRSGTLTLTLTLASCTGHCYWHTNREEWEGSQIPHLRMVLAEPRQHLVATMESTAPGHRQTQQSGSLGCFLPWKWEDGSALFITSPTYISTLTRVTSGHFSGVDTGMCSENLSLWKKTHPSYIM